MEIERSILQAPVVKRYQRIALITIGAIVFLIFVGGFVRMTGSGMGCPDWPKCFGSWVPPTEASQLPANYQELYKDHGYASMEFNAFKTWTEYINRLIGVLVGFLTLLTAGAALGFQEKNKSVTWLSLGVLFLTLVQGGLGAYVVRTNLKTGVITLHMIVAIGILLVLIAAYLQSRRDEWKAEHVVHRPLIVLGCISLALTLVQIVLGTQVRESVDLIAIEMGESRRNEWLTSLRGAYSLHKYFYYTVTLSVVLWFLRLRPVFAHFSLLKGLSVAMLAVLVMEALAGIAMHRLGLPAYLQPLHLLGATLLIGFEFALVYMLILSERNVKKQALAPVE